MSKLRLARYAVKYGPHVLVAAQRLKEPAKEYAQKQLTRQRARRAAFEQAGTLREGSVLKVFHDGEPHWVVFAGEDPVDVLPPAPVPTATLVERADLAKRVRPEDLPSAGERAKAIGGRLTPRRRRRPRDAAESTAADTLGARDEGVR